MVQAWIKISILITLFSVAMTTTSALAPECTPEQEFFCQTTSKFAWCEDSKYVETCPLNLRCNTDLEYLCVQHTSSLTTTSNIETTTTEIILEDDNSTYPDYEEIDNPWNTESTPPSSCTKAGKFPDSNDCNSYHICIPNINGTLTHVTVNCPGNSHYSVQLGRCTVPEKARCEHGLHLFKCPSSGRIPDRKDCNSFILCYPDGTWRRYFCPLHSYFDPITLKCSFSKSVCQPFLNQFNCTSRGLFSDKYNCRKFHYCIPYNNYFVEGFAYCPKYSVFNPNTSRCTKDFNICNKVEKFCADKRASKYPNPDDCSSFYVCTHGDAVSYKCPYGSHYNAQTSRCIFENRSACGRVIQPCTEEGRFSDLDTNCSGFYVCILKHHTWIKQHYKCPGNSTFDVTEKRCLTNATCNSDIL